MEIQKINLKIIIFIILIGLGGYFLYKKYEKYSEVLDNRVILEENLEELNKKIFELKKEQEKKKSEIKDEFMQVEVLVSKLSKLSLRNESEFKKMIFVFAKESDLKLREISKSESVWERNGYKLKYIHFVMYGSLNDFGKFLFFVNKSSKYIDTSKTYISLTNEGFKISLGFLEKNVIEVN